MWVINTILDGGDLEEAIINALAINAERSSHLPPPGFLLAMLARTSKAMPEVPSSADVTIVERRAIRASQRSGVCLLDENIQSF